VTAGAGGVTIEPLTGNDAAALSTFPCRQFREPWTDLVEEMVQSHLAEALRRGDVEGAGLWVQGILCGVAAWTIEGDDPRLCHSHLLAVRTGHVRRGYGRLLKLTLIERARYAGAVAVVSTVAWDNRAMIELNASLGGSVERIAGDRTFCRCVIPLPPA